MPKIHFPTQGNPYVDSIYQYGQPIGDELYVDSGKGTATGPGYSPESAYSTIGLAAAAAVANNGTVITVIASHAESCIGAAGIAISKSGIIIEGHGAGRTRPTITFSTSTAAQMTVTGNNVTFRNIIFDFTGIDAIVAAISVTGTDVMFDSCEFVVNNATIGCVLGILTAATATRLKFTNCRFLGVKTSSGTTTTACIQHEVGENVLITGCQFFGKMTQAILNATTSLLGLIDSCHFHIFTGTKGVSVAAATQWTVRNSTFIVASGTAPIVGTVVNVIGNAYSTEGVGVVAGSAKTF